MFKNIKIDRYQRTPEQVFQQLRDMIVKMVLEPGERVSEQDIAKSFGVSRTPVREAVFQLTNVGLLKVLPQRGTFIAKFRRDFLQEAVFIRRALEEAVISTVAGNLDNKIIDYLQRIRKGSIQMSNLIDALLKLSRLTRSDINIKKVDLSSLVELTIKEYESE